MDPEELFSKHLDSHLITDETVLQGAGAALDDFETKAGIPSQCIGAIREATMTAIQSVKDQRPRRTTCAQWSQALAEAASEISLQMLIDTLPLGLSSEETGEEVIADQKLYWAGNAEIAHDHPDDPQDIIVHQRHISSTDPFSTASFIKVHGGLRSHDEDIASYRQTENASSKWIPIAGPKLSEVFATSTGSKEAEDSTAGETAEPQGFEMSTANRLRRRDRLRSGLTTLSKRLHW